ncbi:hypothetical protein JCM10212_005103 [Sporobolomyces blumeae]
MTDRATYPPSPPSTTSLPDHFSFPSPFSYPDAARIPTISSSSSSPSDDPPPTDGPNTRSRISRGLLPTSGTVKPLPPRPRSIVPGPSSVLTTSRSSLEGWDGSTRTRSLETHWDRSDLDDSSLGRADRSHVGSTPSHSTTSAIEPLFAFDALRPASSFPRDPCPSPFGFGTAGEERNRVFSQCTIIDHGEDDEGGEGFDTATLDKDFVGSSRDAGVDQRLGPVERGGGALAARDTVATGLGMTREEWLRLGGFLDSIDDTSAGLATSAGPTVDARVGTGLLDTTNAGFEMTPVSLATSTSTMTDGESWLPHSADMVESVSTASASTTWTSTSFDAVPASAPPLARTTYPYDEFSLDRCPSTAPISTVFPPTPVEPGHEFATYHLPDLGIPTLSSASSATFTLPTPPPQFQPNSTVSLGDPREPPLETEHDLGRPTSRTRKAPSPILSKRPRPEPYPTSTYLPLAQQPPTSLPRPTTTPTSTELVVPPISPTALRNLTPVTSALLSYKHFSIPSSPPRPCETPKKSHGRKTSVGHIPRPRNAFILFRSYAVSSGLVPKSIGIRDHKNISQVVGSVWRGLSDEERREWEELAEKEKEEHRVRYPEYKFKPKPRGARAPAGMGKKTLARKARELADEDDDEEKEEEEEKVEEVPQDAQDEKGDTSVDEIMVGGGNGERQTREVKVAKGGRKTKKGEERKVTRATRRKMEMIGQAVLEGEDEASLAERIKRGGTMSHKPTSQVKTHGTPKKSPRKQGTATKEDIVVDASPSGSSSTMASPHRTPTKRNPRAALSSPASSNSPSPQRMQHPCARTPPSETPPASSPSKHPLSRSHGAGQAVLGVNAYLRPIPSVLLPASTSTSAPELPRPPSTSSPFLYAAQSSSLDHIPLFTGESDSRKFSLGRWELRKPSANPSPHFASTVTPPDERGVTERREEDQREGLYASKAAGLATTQGLMERSLSSNDPAPTRRIVSSLVLDPREFLAETGLEYDAARDGDDDKAGETCSTWESVTDAPSLLTSNSTSSISSASRYAPSIASSSSVPTTVSSRYDHARAHGPNGVTPPGRQRDSSFHFGSVDLFAKPPQPLFGRTVSSASSSSFAGQGDVFAPEGSVGLGLTWGREQER